MRLGTLAVLVGSCLGICVGCRTKTGNGPPPAMQQAAAPVATPVGSQASEPVTTPLPSRHQSHSFDLTKLQPFYFDKTMTSQQRLEGLLKYLKDEMSDPSCPGMGLGGTITSGYIQLQMVGVLGQTVEAKDIAAARDQEADPALRERLTVALGFARDRSVAQELVEILTHHPEGYMREAAARGLHDLKDPSSKEVLRAALADPYSAFGISDVGPGPYFVKLYPVRGMAVGALQAMGEKVDGAVTQVPLEVGGIPEGLSSLFEEKQPDVCLSTVQLLGQYGQEGLPYLKTFVEQNQTDETLKDAVEAAKAIIAAQDAPTAESARP